MRNNAQYALDCMRKPLGMKIFHGGGPLDPFTVKYFFYPNFESCVWRAVSSHLSHHPHEVLLAQFSLYVHKCGIKPDSFHLTRLTDLFFVLLCVVGTPTHEATFMLFV